jgi:hypothetical protein
MENNFKNEENKQNEENSSGKELDDVSKNKSNLINGQQVNKSENIKSLEELFKKTVTKPHIYYLPLTDIEVIEKKNRNLVK